MGPADHHCHDGQARICTEKVRDRHDIVIVQEKLDGSNVGVAKKDGRIHALTRSGHAAQLSRFPQHRIFSDWVNRASQRERFDALLREGERVCGEWIYQAHGTMYELRHEPFVAFDIMVEDERLPFIDFRERVGAYFVCAHALSVGPPVSIAEAMRRIGEFGHHGAIEPVEGAVWRVERMGKVDFLAKYVRHDKADGKYLESENQTGMPILNKGAEKFEL